MATYLELKAQAERVLRRRRDEQRGRQPELVPAGAAAGAGSQATAPRVPAPVAAEPAKELRQASGGQRQQPKRTAGPGRARPGGRKG